MTDTKIEKLSYEAKLISISDKGLKWNVKIGSYETEYTARLGHYFDVYGYKAMVCNRNALHYLINGSHKLRDNKIFLVNRLIREFTFKDLNVTDKIKVVSNYELIVKDPSKNDVLYALYSEASLVVDHDIDDFAKEFMPNAKITEVLECYKACEKSLKFIVSSFGIDGLRDYFETIGLN